MHADQILKLVYKAANNGMPVDFAISLGAEIAKRRDAGQSLDCDAFRTLCEAGKTSGDNIPRFFNRNLRSE